MTPTLVIENNEKAILVSAKELEQITYIQYLIAFSGSITQDDSTLDLVLALFDLDSEVIIMHPIFAERLGSVVRTTNVGAQKIDGTTLKTYEIVVAAFSVADQANRVRIFGETFLVANVSPDVVFEMLFLTLSNANVNFSKKELQKRLYTIEKALPTTKRVKLVGIKEFVAAALDPGYETFIVYVASLESPNSIQEGDVHPSCRVQIAALMANKAPTSISTKYSDFADVFSPELASEIPEHTWINDHAIELVDD